MVALWKKNKFLFIFLIIIIFLFPAVLSKESLTYSHLICVGVGIDKQDDEYEVSLQVIVPQQSSNFNESLKVLSGKGDTINEAINQIKYHVGKDVGFSQCEFIVFNEDATKDNILLPIDYFVRTHNINYNCILVCTDKSANQVLELNGKLGQSYSFDLSRILEFNETNLFSQDTNIEQAYKAFLSENSAFAISLISTSSKAEEGIEAQISSSTGSSGGESGGDSQSGGSQGKNEEDNVLVNKGEIALFKKGKFICTINDSEINGIELINPIAKSLQIKLANFTDEFYDNATIELEVTSKLANITCNIVGDKLKMDCDVLLNLRLYDIMQKNNFDRIVETNKNYYTKDLVEEIKRTQKLRLLNSVEKLKEINVDLLNAYNLFNRWKHKEFKNYLKNYNLQDDYLQNIELSVNFNIIGS